jgi:murein DD-endopeptidase MepM/ murein hydrolase activator NlpD
MAQIQAGTDPTIETTPTTTPNSPVAVTDWVWVAAGTAEISFEETEIKRKDYVYPVPNAKINSAIGTRTIEGMWTHMHKGIDIADTEGTPIVSIADGKIESVWFGSATGWFSGYGNYMVVKLKNGYRVLYGHMQKHAQKASGIERKIWDIIKKFQNMN